MSKMSRLQVEIEECAQDLGFKSYEEAERAGYIADYITGKLTRPLDELDEAHEFWLDEKKYYLNELTTLADEFDVLNRPESAKRVRDVITFFKRGEI